jgi:single-strand DNA-binding protein
MATMNSVVLLGNMTRDPQLQYTPGKGTAVARFGIALNRKVNEKDYVTFVDIEVWGKLAETCNTYLKKGRQIALSGELRLDRWNDKTTGDPRQRLYVVAHNVQFLGTPAQGEPSDPEVDLQAADDAHAAEAAKS